MLVIELKCNQNFLHIPKARNEDVQNISFWSLKKPPTRENWDKLSVYYSIFEYGILLP